MRNALLGKVDAVFTPTELGPLFEQWVILQLISFSAYHGEKFKVTSYRDSRGLEVDIIIETANEIWLIEVKYQNKFRHEFGENLRTLKGILKSSKLIKMFVIYTGDTKQKTSDGIFVVPYSVFLKDLA